MRNIAIISAIAVIINFFGANAAWNELHKAVHAGNEQEARAILTRPGITSEQQTALLNEQSQQGGTTPLHLAVMNKCERMVSLLLAFNPRQDIYDHHGYLPIHWAAICDDISIMKILLQHGSPIESRTKETEETPLHLACYNYKQSAAVFLLEHGANANAQDSQGWVSLRAVAASDDITLARVLLRYDAWTTIADNVGWTPSERVWATMQQDLNNYHSAHIAAQQELFTLLFCLYKRHGAILQANSVLLEWLKRVYRTEKLLHYNDIEPISGSLLKEL